MNLETFEELERRLTEERGWTAAEQKLIAEIGGERIVIGQAVPQEELREGEAANSIRAELLRWFILSDVKGARPPAAGLTLAGAWISGPLDLQSYAVPAPLGLAFCRFDGEIRLLEAKTRTLNLQGSHLQPSAGGAALSADGAEIAGGVFLRDRFRATGAVRLLGATIGGNLDRVGGQFENEDGDALNANAAEIAGVLFLRNPPSGPGSMFDGALDLTAAEIGVLADAEDCWP